MDYQKVIRAAQAAGKNPAELRLFKDLAPVSLPDHLFFYYHAFNELCSCRANHRSPDGQGMIPWSSINDYAIRYNLTGAAFEVFRKYIEAMDLAYCRYYDKKMQDQIDKMNKDAKKNAQIRH